MKLSVLPFFLLFFSFTVQAQKLEYATMLIPDSLKQNANAVIRLNEVNISIPSQKEMVIKSKIVTTVLNELGLRSLDLSENYDKSQKILKIEAVVFDAFGKELKTIKRKDFKDQSTTDGGTVFSDSRMLYADYVPVSYPFTVEFVSEIETNNTVFIPSWSPIQGYLVSTQASILTISYLPDLKLNAKELNFSSKFQIEKTQTDKGITYSAKNLTAKKYEELSPDFEYLFPKVMFGLTSFSLEGVNGHANSWSEMGKWFYEEILSGTADLPIETKEKIKALVGNESDPMKKAAIVYKYVQEKTRYVSIQEGIGGWKPMQAKDVDKLGYGDCKALTNYTKTLLDEVGVKSYYARLYGDTSKRDIHTDIVSFQSNHVILAIPDKSNYVWLECTSQTNPFGFQGDFTDDRNAFIIKPEGGEIVKTKTYTETESLRTIKGAYSVNQEGKLTGKIKMISQGIQYDHSFGKERMSKEDQTRSYKDEFANINNLSIKKMQLTNDKNKIEFTEELEMEAESYAQNSAGKLMFALNAFDQNSYVPKKYKTREFPFEVIRGYTDEDEIEISIPEGYIFEAKPNNAELKTEFGEYKIEFVSLNPKTIICKRKLVIKKGFYESAKYESYRKFREAIAKLDNSKTVISKS
ncbi:DUF3857 domain-containing protein [Flavobacterium sp.]|uniref:DUF3857 domain-containing protein n=1 Tax=Flavobacterium sp. TaxID=239 RepID=UPI00391A6E48